jgi:Ca-activated chloride channel family protein
MPTMSPRPFLRGLAAALLATATAAAPAQQVRLAVEPGQDLLPAGETRTLFLKIALEGLPIAPRAERPPVNVALVLDRSGSMSGDKLRHAREAAILALDHLHREDVVSVVTYDHLVDVLVPATRLHDRAGVTRAVRAIRAGGNTALFAGVSKGAAELAKFHGRHQVNRLVLLSDGLANVGPSEPAELARLGRRLGGRGVSVTTVGLGLGYNEDLMARLAAASDGNHVFAERPEELAAVFRNEFGELGTVVAQGLTITIQCRDGVRPLRVLGREADIRGDRVTATLNQVYADQEKYLLLEVEVPPGRAGDARELATVEVTYDDLAARRSERLQASTRVRYTGSPAAAERSVDADVMVSAGEQIGAALDEEALELKDQGDVAGAAALFRRKAEFLEQEAARLDSPRLREQAAAGRAAEEAVTAPAPEWRRARKALRADQHAIQQQQSYK